MKANQISAYVISLTQNNREEDLTNMKLQKILYYLQGYYLALFDDPLFENEIEAWKYGPVICDEYHTYKVYGNNPIIIPDTNLDFDYLNALQKNFIIKVYSYFRQFSPIKLMELTHKDGVWLAAYGKTQIISKEELKSFFDKSALKENFKILEKKEERKDAAEFLLVDYLYNDELTDFTTSDTEDIYEY